MGSGDRPLVSHSIVWLCAHLHSGRALNRGLDQVGLQLNWESTEGEGSVVADACSASEDSSSQESAETAKPAHAVGLLTESMRPVSFTMKWCSQGRALHCQVNASQEYIPVYWSMIIAAIWLFFFLKYNFNVYRKCILFAYLLFKWCGLFTLFGKCHR